jgi:pyruvyltransferase
MGDSVSAITLRRAKIPNLGDSMNDNLLHYISGKTFNVVNHQSKVPGPVLIAIGSILQWADNHTIVWGSGFISAKSAIQVQPKMICAVRGPLSRQRILDLGFQCPDIYGDPALLYPRYFHPPVLKKHKLGLVAHYIDRHDPLFIKLVKTGAVLDINVKGPVNETITKILSCERIISSSLHGLIIADAYGIPSVWIKITDGVIGLGFKFRDYFSSVGRTDIVPLVVNSGTTIKDLLNKFHPYELKIDLDRLFSVCPVKP